MELSRHIIADALTRLGERLFAAGAEVRFVIAGGACLSLLEVITRSTTDVDVIAWGDPADPRRLSRPPATLPLTLENAVDAVGRELGLAPDWFDLRVAHEWITGLPRDFERRVRWTTYGRALHVGLAGRADLIYLKLVAAADRISPKHERDLHLLAPSDDELEDALRFARSTQVGMDEALDVAAQLCREARHA